MKKFAWADSGKGKTEVSVYVDLPGSAILASSASSADGASDAAADGCISLTSTKRSFTLILKMADEDGGPDQRYRLHVSQLFAEIANATHKLKRHKSPPQVVVTLKKKDKTVRWATLRQDKFAMS